MLPSVLILLLLSHSFWHLKLLFKSPSLVTAIVTKLSRQFGLPLGLGITEGGVPRRD